MLATALDQLQVISFFDSQAPNWDACNKAKPEKLETILDFAHILPGDKVLDVACGTGILFPYYLKKEVAKVVGVDISEKMIARAQENYTDRRIELHNLDIEKAVFTCQFNQVVVFNALPHFNSPSHLIPALARFTEPGGRLTIAHDMGRAHLNTVHCRKAMAVSLGLISETELSSLFLPFFTVDCMISNEDYYVVSGLKNR
ncbi:methyltransferase family protein [Sphaerochaeta pleomorpha str. Grapes]|uniref:Methyltransferase family protein n=1 Tax=Sphaerochaeta pleomorpha (strain ATCC BAA-1885 / DSM 22778 / Grapes) TaxID=158190 RepID=G8QTX6_SPHPG|nr:methyltransferase domain-containing protein [Sphaerochaeta pleomorpha]AEV29152.1 methyltransferase family protein [Sphaerochaeta pleomorpha str. Grapes]